MCWKFVKKTGICVPFVSKVSGFMKRRVSEKSFAFWGMLSCAALGLGVLAGTNASAITGTRTISFFNTHTKQNLTVTYKRFGQNIPVAMRKINYILRDWRTNQVVRMDPMLIDLLWEVHTGLGSRKPIHIMSGYRSPRTNAMLRRRSRAVSRVSRHMFGMAADVRFPDISVKKLRNFAMRKQRGGVGYYRGSFVHMDVGNVRHWPRMSRRELAKLFPKGGALHVARGVARPKGGRVGPRSLPRPTVIAKAPAGVVRGAPANRISTPTRVQVAAVQPQSKRRRVKPRSSFSVRLARGNIPLPRSRPAQSTLVAAAPVFNGPVPLPRANPLVLTRMAQLNAPQNRRSNILVASANIPVRSLKASREVAIARPVARSTVKVITARPVKLKQAEPSLFGLASILTGFSSTEKTRSVNAPIQVASAARTNRPHLADGHGVNRKRKGNRLITHAALERKLTRIRVASRLPAPVFTGSARNNPFRPEEPVKKSSPFGLLTSLFPMFAPDKQPLKRKQ